MRPGISISASSISRRPKAANEISATLNFWAGAELMIAEDMIMDEGVERRCVLMVGRGVFVEE
jgi:hypothetical protein